MVEETMNGLTQVVLWPLHVYCLCVCTLKWLNKCKKNKKKLNEIADKDEEVLANGFGVWVACEGLLFV